MTSGSTAIARAMQSRCCWPPERPSADFLSRFFTSSQSAARLQRLLDAVVEVVLHPEDAQAVGDVVVDRLRERVRPLEDHADAAANLDRVDVACRRGRRRGRGPSRRRCALGTRSFIRFRQRSNVDLPQPDGPISAVIAFSWMSSETPLTASALPYETDRSSMSNTTSRASPAPAAASRTVERRDRGCVRLGGSTTLTRRVSTRPVRRGGTQDVNVV